MEEDTSMGYMEQQSLSGQKTASREQRFRFRDGVARSTALKPSTLVPKAAKDRAVHSMKRQSMPAGPPETLWPAP